MKDLINMLLNVFKDLDKCKITIFDVKENKDNSIKNEFK